MQLSGSKRKAGVFEEMTTDENTFKVAIPFLVAMLNGTNAEKERAVSLLAGILNCNPTNGNEIVNCCGIAPLVELLKGTCEQKRSAADVLALLASWKRSNIIKIGGTEAVAPFIELLQGTDSQKECAAKALKYLAMEDVNRCEILRLGGIPFLVDLLTGTEKQSEYAALALMNIANKTMIMPRRLFLKMQLIRLLQC